MEPKGSHYSDEGTKDQSFRGWPGRGPLLMDYGKSEIWTSTSAHVTTPFPRVIIFFTKFKIAINQALRIIHLKECI